MNLRNPIPVFLAVLLGFLLGAMFTHQTPVKAQAVLQVYVQHTWATVMPVAPTSVPGSQIVGFSCSTDKSSGDLNECLIAYTK